MAQLILQDGTVFQGEPFGAMEPDPMAPEAERARFGAGEVVFTTGMVGYPESLTDPSYRGQILVFTYPLIGNYGVPSEEPNEWGFSRHFESEAIQVQGVVCAQVSEHASHWSAEKTIREWLREQGIPGLTGMDTRALTKKLREHGVMLGALRANGEWKMESGKFEVEDPNKRNLVAEVSCREVHVYEPGGKQLVESGKTVVAYDCGMKRNILRSFLRRGVRIVRVPWNFDLSRADFPYDGIFISNGPGDPKMYTETIRQIQWAIERNIPTFGICLGNQLMALAIGGDTYKLKYGHRGANQPCLEVAPVESRLEEVESGKCIITSQNHGYAVSEELPKGWHVWWRNANDGTVEGIRHESGRFFAVQFHPEATPGPEDANYLFDDFLHLLR
jgi:carbamoyl-phosphate synthase small subunit